jgi:hypothetical protein
MIGFLGQYIGEVFSFGLTSYWQDTFDLRQSLFELKERVGQHVNYLLGHRRFQRPTIFD